MLKDMGLRDHLVLLTLLPSIVLTAVLGFYFIKAHENDTQRQLLMRGQIVAQQVAPLVTPVLQTDDRARLQLMLRQVLNQPDVRAIAVRDPQRRLIAQAGPDALTPPPPNDPQALTHVSSDVSTRILLPLLKRHLLLGPTVDSDPGPPLGWLELELSHDGTKVHNYRNLFDGLLLIGVVLLGTIAGAIHIGKTISRPLQQIKLAVAQLKDGHLETRLPPLGDGEMNELAAGINRMAEALLNAREELQQNIDQATEDVRHNLETIEIQNIELDMARKEALEASRIKSEFLANISHEIRTPLNGIIGFTNLLQKSDLSARQQEYLSTIEKSAANLLAIINEILDFSKIEAGKLMLESIPFNLRDLIEDTLAILAPAAHHKQLELVCLIYRDTPVQLIGDPLRLRQVLTNLVSNAIKFTNQGNIVVRAMLEEESDTRARLRISVQDTGIGLTRREIDSLFKAFSQADHSLSRQPGGTGLGLVISKHLIEQMGGEIGVESEPQQGSDFWIVIDLPKALDDVDGFAPPPLLGRRVALLDRHPLARQALEHQLADCGLDVRLCDDLDQVRASVNAAGAQPIDYAMLDLNSLSVDVDSLPAFFQELDAHGCKSLLLCPTTLPARQQDQLEQHARLLGKPACTRQLQQALIELASPLRLPQERLSTPLTRAPHILCVDDNPANLLLVKTLLTDMGARVEAVDNGREAIAAVRQHTFDLVFMDMQMPGLNGRQTTEAIRRWEQEQNRAPLPIVALTAHALSSEKRALLQSGMDDYLTKPIGERQLAQVVLKWTGLSLRQHPHWMTGPAQPENEQRVLDDEEGLRLAAGREDLARDMLCMLLASLGEDRTQIRAARREEDRDALIEHIHRLNGATRYCGVPQLRTACQHSETQLKQGRPLGECGLDDLEKAIERLALETGVTLERAGLPGSRAPQNDRP